MLANAEAATVAMKSALSNQLKKDAAAAAAAAAVFAAAATAAAGGWRGGGVGGGGVCDSRDSGGDSGGDSGDEKADAAENCAEQGVAMSTIESEEVVVLTVSPINELYGGHSAKLCRAGQ